MVETAVASLRSIVADLVGHGASDLLVPNLPDVGMTPKLRARGYLFWDGVHPTTQAHGRLADAALEAMSLPVKR
jgi:phospholipase/lecithinase/hemolysin